MCTKKRKKGWPIAINTNRTPTTVKSNGRREAYELQEKNADEIHKMLKNFTQ